MLSLVANAESERLLTIEVVIGPLANGTASPRAGADSFRNPEIEVNLWDVNSREAPIKKLDVPESDLPRRPIMAAFSPDGKTLALAYSVNRMQWFLSSRPTMANSWTPSTPRPSRSSAWPLGPIA